ncbi:MAG: alpha-1,2-fucosyltransferase, partial [Proteobacteria bacterium]|nr:alpha-1,2-fucosyltransferase [Pseudomonadota bacterium]
NFDLNLLKKKNSVSISVRTNRYNERSKEDLSNPKKILKSDLFVKETIKYIYNAVDFFKKKIDKPSFFVWSNDLNNLKEYFNDDFTFVDIKKNKIINDLYTMSLCNNFIIGPTTFHWWGAYLSKNNHKNCILPPKHLPFSSNLDIYPETWIKF